MSTDHVRNVSGILSHAKAKSETVKQRIDLAIESLMRENLAVNFNSVILWPHVPACQKQHYITIRSIALELNLCVATALPQSCL